MYISKKEQLLYYFRTVYFWRRKMNILNHYKTKNLIIMQQRYKRYLNMRLGYCKDFKLNRIGIFKELPDDVLILQDYVNQIVLRTMYIHEDIYLHSIYIKYPELFEY